MAGMFAAQLARLGRRSGVWLLTAALIVLNVLVAKHNVDGVRAARADLASASAGRIVRNCVVYGGYPAVTTCPQQTVPYLMPVRGPKRRPHVTTCTPTGCKAVPSGSKAAVTFPAGAGYVVVGVPPCTSAGCPPTRVGIAATQQPQHQQIREAVQASRQSLGSAAGGLAPGQRAHLALSLLSSLPGLTLALLLGAVAAGRGYRRKTWTARIALARGQPRVLAARLTALWLVTFCWIVAGVAATLVTYAVLAGRAHLAAWGVPAIPLPALLGTWLSLGLVASLAAAVSAAPRTASLLVAASHPAPAPEPVTEHE